MSVTLKRAALTHLPTQTSYLTIPPKSITEAAMSYYRAAIVCGLFHMLVLDAAWGDEPASATPAEAATEKPADSHRVPLATARDRAKVMHNVYATTLEVIHDRYFHGDRAVIPARAMEDVFSEMKRQMKIEARWISVNLRAMSIDHEPETEFERQAAKALSAEQSDYEKVEGGHYRRAERIPLHDGCISCHGGFLRTNDKKQRFAALVISVPLADKDVADIQSQPPQPE
ncbi:MAG: DUF3365 domain-containing protein [Planctomycetales bacterium]|nr:DUF3365 domain-containing protein [Planctomycetales bacterium]